MYDKKKKQKRVNNLISFRRYTPQQDARNVQVLIASFQKQKPHASYFIVPYS